MESSNDDAKVVDKNVVEESIDLEVSNSTTLVSNNLVNIRGCSKRMSPSFGMATISA